MRRAATAIGFRAMAARAAPGMTLLLAMALPSHAATPAIGAGRGHTVALHASGTPITWGHDDNGQLGIGRTASSAVALHVAGMPALRPGSASIAASSSTGIAIAADGTAWAWGLNTFGGLGDGTQAHRPTPAPMSNLTNVVSVAMGFGFTVAVTADGSLWTSGLAIGSSGGRTLPGRVEGISNAVAVSAGVSHALVLLADGTVRAWGENADGQLGDGTTTRRATPVQVAGLDRVARIAAGPSHDLALKSDGTVWAWGSNTRGQLGDGTVTTRLTAVQVAALARAIAAGRGPDPASYMVRTDGSLWRWGPGGGLTPAPLEGYADIVEVSAGHAFWVALRADGTVLTAGENQYGQLGRATASLQPAPVSGLPPIAAIAAGETFVLAAAADGRLFSWGNNSGGQLGIVQSLNRTTPSAVALTLVTQVASGSNAAHTLAVRADGSLWGWGNNYFGTLGNRDVALSSSPIAVEGISQVAQAAVGGNHSAALRADGSVWTWGLESSGQLGRATNSEPIASFRPSPVAGLPPVVKVAAGASHTLAVGADGSVWAWGNNADGQLGASTTQTCVEQGSSSARRCATRPLQVPGITNVIDVAAALRHSLALRSDGTVWAWGTNQEGTLGDGSSTDRASPVMVAGLADVVRIAAGATGCPNCGGHSLALRRDGTVWSWGANQFGALGDGTTAPSARAKPVEGLAGIVAIAAGDAHGLALRADGVVLAWGTNNNGALGDGTVARRLRPVVVVRENGAGSLEGSDWFLDLDPAVSAPVAVDKAFGVVAQGNVEGSRADVSAQITYRASDVGSSAGVYVFALAPASSVQGAAAMKSSAPPGVFAKVGAKDTAVACVLAQLNASGQLQAVSAAALQAYVSGVLAAQGQAVTILNGVPTVNIGGATFFVGYGPNSSTVVNGGNNRSVASVPGALECKPQAPKTGWWWDPPPSAGARSPRDGTGYSIEVNGANLFFAAFLYEASGRSSWYVASGRTSLDGSLFVGELLQARGGQTLGGPYRNFSSVTSAGPITLAFNSATSGTMSWPGGTVPLGRFDIVPGGTSAAPRPNTPEAGWWWNPDESGRGFFIEWQDGNADLAGYMYDDAGNPVWYITVVPTPDPMRLSGNWLSFGNGMTLTGPWRPHQLVNPNVAPVTVTFTSATTATMTLPNGRATSLVRHRF